MLNLAQHAQSHHIEPSFSHVYGTEKRPLVVRYKHPAHLILGLAVAIRTYQSIRTEHIFVDYAQRNGRGMVDNVCVGVVVGDGATSVSEGRLPSVPCLPLDVDVC